MVGVTVCHEGIAVMKKRLAKIKSSPTAFFASEVWAAQGKRQCLRSVLEQRARHNYA